MINTGGLSPLFKKPAHPQVTEESRVSVTLLGGELPNEENEYSVIFMASWHDLL